VGRLRMSIGLLVVGLSISSVTDQARAHGVNTCEREMIRASRAHGVPLGVLYAVGLTETGSRNAMRPYLLNVEGRSVSATTLHEAVNEFNAARRAGARLIDLGCMQINHHFHSAQFDSVEAMLDPVRNVDYAARFLKELRAREGNWTMAAARYNAGPNNDPAQKRYVCRVITNMVASGFGAWTLPAREFCR
jgi:soluble lytic murein transglycosylase-like protein